MAETCDCGRPQGQCVKGDMDYCPALDDDEDDDDVWDINCGMGPGGCSLAGTEWCDWSCPHSDEAPHNKRAKRKPLPLFDDVDYLMSE